MPPSPDGPEFWVEDASEDGWGSDVGWATGDEVYGSQTSAWDASRPTDDEPATTRPGPPPPGPRRWVRWAALAVGLVVIAGIIAWQSRTGTAPDLSIQDSTPTATAPTTGPGMPTPGGPSSGAMTPTSSPAGASSSVDERQPVTYQSAATDLTDPALLAGATWQLVGFGPDGVLRYNPATGRLVNTRVPGIASNGPQSVIVTPDATIIHPFDSVLGYLVRDGDVAVPLQGLLSDGGPALPGPDPDHVWVMQQARSGQMVVDTDDDSSTYTLQAQDLATHAQLVLVDLTGASTGVVIDVPDTGGINPGYQVYPDGTGYALFDGVGGTYRLMPGGPRLITHGKVLAIGPAAMLLGECDDAAKCSGVVLDPATGDRRPLPGLTAPTDYLITGVTSPDGRWAAMLNPSTGEVALVDLQSGAMTTPYKNPDARSYDTTPTMAFSPDGRFLLITRMVGVAVIDTASGQSLGMLPVHPLATIAVRPHG